MARPKDAVAIVAKIVNYRERVERELASITKNWQFMVDTDPEGALLVAVTQARALGRLDVMLLSASDWPEMQPPDDVKPS